MKTALVAGAERDGLAESLELVAQLCGGGADALGSPRECGGDRLRRDRRGAEHTASRRSVRQPHVR